MLVAFDYQVFYWQSYGGISRYICELARALSVLDDTQVRIVAPLHVNRYLEKLDGMNVLGWRVPEVPLTTRLRRHAGHAVSRLVWWLDRPRVVHETYYAPSGTAPAGVPVVLTVHDMIHERFPESFPPGDKIADWKRSAVRRADHVVCVSESTRADLLAYTDVEPAKVSVIPHGYSRLARSAPVAAAVSSMKPHILYVGPRRGHKNFSVLLSAFSRSAKLRRTHRLLCFGGGPLTAQEMHDIQQLGLHPADVVQQDGDDAALASAYVQASVFAYPSLYEGFGLPILEAMAMGCPVACAQSSSLPEVAADAAEYFDPGDADSVAATLEKLLYDSARCAQLRSLGAQRVQLFTWGKCAAATLAVYQSVT